MDEIARIIGSISCKVLLQIGAYSQAVRQCLDPITTGYYILAGAIIAMIFGGGGRFIANRPDKNKAEKGSQGTNTVAAKIIATVVPPRSSPDVSDKTRSGQATEDTTAETTPTAASSLPSKSLVSSALHATKDDRI